MELLFLVGVVRGLLEERNTSFEVFGYLLVGLSHRTTGIVGLEVNYAALDIGYTRIFLAGRWIIRQAEEVRQTEVPIGTGNEGLSLCSEEPFL